MAVNNLGDVLVAGNTLSTDFEGRNNAHHGGVSDAFLLEVSSEGILQWMTYYGGGGSDAADGVVLDGAGDVRMTGITYSVDFEGSGNTFHGGEYDAFVLSVNSAGILQWMIYLGGGGADHTYDIDLDSASNLLIAGRTTSTEFEGATNVYHGGASDACVARISSSGVLQWVRYLGGSDTDVANGIAVDGSGDVFITGTTYSIDFEGQNNLHHGGGILYFDAFVVKVDAWGSLQWMTYLGGGAGDGGVGISVDATGNALTTGFTGSTDFEGRVNAYRGGSSDAFVAMVHTSGSLEWMTFLGGSDSDDGVGIALDTANDALVGGSTWSDDFEGRSNSFHGNVDAFIAKVRLEDRLRMTVTATCPSGGPIAVSWINATRNGRVALIFALDLDEFLVPANYPCQGTQLGLGANQVQLVGDYGAGATGERTINGYAGNGACGGYLQLLDLTTCGTSNVARIE